MRDVDNIDRSQDDQAEQISAVLRLAGVSQAAKVIRILNGGMNLVYMIDDELVVKLNDRRDGRTFERESKTLHAIRGEIKAPELVFSDFSQTQVSLDIIVLKKIQGVSLMSEWVTLTDSQRRDYVMQICGELRKLHRIPLDNIQTLIETPWSDRFERYVDECLRLALQDREIDREVVLFLKSYFDMNRRELQNPCQQVLTHNDLHFGNVLVSQGKLQALLDFEYAGIGQLDFELAKIINFCLTPSQYASKSLERHFDKPMLETLKWFMEFYPELFQHGAITTRQRLFLIPEILWGFKVAHMQKPCSDNDRPNAISVEELERNRQKAYNKLHHIFGEQFPFLWH